MTVILWPSISTTASAGTPSSTMTPAGVLTLITTAAQAMAKQSKNTPAIVHQAPGTRWVRFATAVDHVRGPGCLAVGTATWPSESRRESWSGALLRRSIRLFHAGSGSTLSGDFIAWDVGVTAVAGWTASAPIFGASGPPTVRPGCETSGLDPTDGALPTLKY